MDRQHLREILKEGLNEIPLLDAHTHLDASHLTARGLHDILLYHVLVSDLVSAGCPSRGRLSEDPSDDEAAERMEEALPYLAYVQNTSIFWGARLILRDLYGWTEPVTPKNWRRLDGMVRERASDPGWARQVMRGAGIKRACTEFWRRRDGSADELLQY